MVARPENPFQNYCHEAEAPFSAYDQARYSGTYAGYVTGKVGEPRMVTPGYDSGVMSLVVGTMIVVLFSLKHWRRYFDTFGQDLFSTRRRVDSFETHTIGEAWVSFALVLLMCVFEALALFCVVQVDGLSPFVLVGGMVLCAVAYYLLQLAVFHVVGWLFSDPVGARQLTHGFVSSQALLGMTLVLPVLVALYYPAFTFEMVCIVSALYVLTRLIFIVKGFRVFYDGLSTVPYFIVYLLAIEVAPFALAFRFIYCTVLGKNGLM